LLGPIVSVVHRILPLVTDLQLSSTVDASGDNLHLLAEQIVYFGPIRREHVVSRTWEDHAMSLLLLKHNRLFVHDADGRLLFFATPMAKSAYVVPDRHSEEALRTHAKYWGLCELFLVAIIAPVALHFGALGLLAAFAIFALGTVIAYQLAVRGLVSGLESVAHECIAPEHRMVSIGSLLRTGADETHAGLLWLCEAASLMPFAGAALIVFNGHRMHQFIGGFFAMIYFGSATIAGGYMISAKRHRITVSTTDAFAEGHAAVE
jgi:hypothetical protein